MKSKLNRLTRRYASALRKHLKRGPRASLRPARGLGREAVAIGLETLDVAKIHQGALANLETSSSRDGLIKRAEIFFTETITPIENTHQAALKTKARLSRLQQKLGRHTVDLAASNLSLREGVARRKRAEQALKERKKQSQKLLKESRQLEKHLQHLTHQILSAQEDKRKKISHDLQDEIGQTLLGIHVRLLTLKKVAGANARSFRKDIANTRRLVNKSMKSIRRFAREFGKDDET